MCMYMYMYMYYTLHNSNIATLRLILYIHIGHFLLVTTATVLTASGVIQTTLIHLVHTRGAFFGGNANLTTEDTHVLEIHVHTHTQKL